MQVGGPENMKRKMMVHTDLPLFLGVHCGWLLSYTNVTV